MSIIITAIIATVLLVSISTSIVIANSIVSQPPPQQQNANMQFIIQAIEIGANAGFVSVILYLLVRLYATTNEQIKILLSIHNTLTDLKTCMVRVESKLDRLIDGKNKYNNNKEEEERDGGN